MWLVLEGVDSGAADRAGACEDGVDRCRLRCRGVVDRVGVGPVGEGALVHLVGEGDGVAHDEVAHHVGPGSGGGGDWSDGDGGGVVREA